MADPTTSHCTAPEITLTEARIFTLGEVVTWTASDRLSGLATEASGFIDTSKVGSHTITITARDIAGNETVETVNYQVVYDFGGILQPINQNGSSVFKAGSTVPVKFQLKDNNGAFITDAVAKIGHSKQSNNVWGNVEEAVSTSAATTGNLFRYDAKDNQYIFNLNTKGLSSGTYKLTISLNDGTTQEVVISLR
ncbi:hyalin [Halalkalibacter akibai JCM 9157]|uniref:Hyalin n=1 Tax=Halalkalibacter akibai (strain ATCC 43226 / DSM 21942 / CIP 109018 / JCM 9157 / 1139) TaxID=1236973 RepID=W4QQT3_HALA3|nr:PxKF domain-containing protein [Halalkalibacter akibai]GAE34445.1 hyalin [Halalkalibacter akibai JCM 9157]